MCLLRFGSHFYPRSPRGERPQSGQGSAIPCRFLSTLPARGATLAVQLDGADGPISIHAPREGSDFYPCLRIHTTGDFYPRSPRGERLADHVDDEDKGVTFLSTLPARGATVRRRDGGHLGPISIHAPREGSDPDRRRTEPQRPHFYPRSPRGERRGLQVIYPNINAISIHAPREGSDPSGAMSV